MYQENTNKLIKYGSQEYNYDAIGNTTNLNETYTSLNWSRGSLLTSMLAYTHGVSFSYSAKGLLTSKSIGSQNWRYLYEGDRLVRQLENSTTAIDFLYGQEGLIGFVYGGNTYLYQKNIFGDIVKILNSEGSVVAEYSYTAFGECNVITNVNNIANVNPFRYRGYFYESNSGLYYLKTRFYNPKTGRFISPDDTKYLQPDTINGLNLYAYCLNNPVMCVDPNGTFVLSTILIAAIAGAVIGVSYAGYKDYRDDREIFNGSVAWYNYLGAGLLGGAIGAGIVAIGYIAPGIASFLGSSFTIGGGLSISGGAAATAGITITGGQIVGVGALAALGLIVLFSRIGKSGGYKIDHHYPNDHEPTHVHISGDDGKTKVDINGNPLKGERPMTYGERKAFQKLLEKIKKVLAPWL